jgi:hypothetical protein
MSLAVAERGERTAQPGAGWVRPQLARRHGPFLAAIGAAAALRILATLAYWPGLELGGDSFDYLGRAQSMTPGTWHPFGYSLVLKALSIFGFVGVVPIAQHLLGLALGVLIYVLLVRLGVRRGLALLAALPVLLDGYQLDIEQFILAETMLDALVLAAFALLVWDRHVSAPRAAGIGALLAAAALTRVAAAPLLAAAGLYLLLRRQWRPLASYAAVAIAILVAYGAWYGATYGSFGYEDYAGYMLYARVAPLATCTYRLPAEERRLCPSQPISLRPKNTEFYTWYQGSPLYQAGLGDHHQRNVLARRFATAVIEQQPLTYAGAVLSDTWHYFTPGRWMTEARIELARFRFPDARTMGDKDLHVTVAQTGFDNRRSRARPEPSLFGFLRGYQSVIYTQGPLLLAALIAGLLAALGLLRSGARRRDARWAAALFAIGGLLIVLVPSMTAAFSYRLGIPLLILLPPAGIIGADLGVDALGRFRRRRMSASMPMSAATTPAGGSSTSNGRP